ncbi:MAG: enoyl-CoA hydratase [Gammaproteobacteria bacterium]|nr:enoyl-CoA hydratase [Gammaproteobacteria bacterium]
MPIESTLRHFQCEIDSNKVAWVYFDTQDANANTFNCETLTELSQLVFSLQAQSLRGLIITSRKKNSFIIGADVHAIGKIKNESEAYQLILEGRQVFDNIAALPFTTVAMVNGFCLGGGLELALACDYIIVEDSSTTKLAFPEVLLGIYPGWGGSVRSVKRLGVLNAMDLMLSGRFICAKQAKKIGLADILVPKRHLKRAALTAVLNPQPLQQPVFWLRALNHPSLRPIIGRLLSKKTAAKASPEHYPAPFVLIENWVKNGVEAAAFQDEAKTVAHLITTNTSHNLVRVFHLRERLKAFTKIDEDTISQVHVIGAGTMGGDIAAVCALHGMRVTLQDTNFSIVAKAMGRAYTLFQQTLKEPHLIQAAMDRLLPDVAGDGIEKADLIIEAIIEDIAAKQALFKTIAAKVGNHVILATNTSSIPLTEISAVLQKPSQLVGIHFFNPVARMPLVEVVSSPETDKRILSRAFKFVGQLDKLPLPVASQPGFLVNRVLMPYLLESVKLLEEGYAGDTIDKAACDFGMPMGPIELADKVGLDVCLSVARNLTAYYGGEVPELLINLVNEKRFGVKTHRGFYEYQSGKPLRNKEISMKGEEVIIERLISCFINESQRALTDKVVSDADLLDAGMVFGTGFAPFRGGPLHYADVIKQGEQDNANR